MFTKINLLIIFTSLINIAESPESTDPGLLTKDTIQTFYPFPALVVRKHRDTKLRYSIPKNVLSTRKDTPPYTAFGNKATYLCPVKKEPSQNINNGDQNFNDRDYCLTKKPVTDFSKPILCESEVKPLIVEIPNRQGEGQRCGSLETDKYYAFVYQKCILKVDFDFVNKIAEMLDKDIQQPKLNSYLYTYNFCYDTVKNDVIYTSYEIKSHLLLTDESLKLERSIDFPMETNGYGIFGDRFENMLKEAYKKNKYSMVPQMLMSPNLMEMGLLRKTTFHYINTKPMNKKLVPIWERIDKLTADIAVRGKLSMKIFSRTIGIILASNGQKLFLENYRTTIPEIWCKLIVQRTQKYDKAGKPIPNSESTEGVAYFLHNFINEDQPILENRYCEEDKCNVKLWSWSGEQGDEVNALAVKYAYCCQINGKILQLFPILLNYMDDSRTYPLI